MNIQKRPNQTKNTHRQKGFTLTELLVVMTIISILAAVGVPTITSLLVTAKQNAAMQNARQIGIGLRLAAMENDGNFPDGTNRYNETIATSNDAFRDIMDYVDNEENIFAVPGSGWGSQADNRAQLPAEMLEAGENHFAYISGLSTSSSSSYPLIVDGTAGGTTYTDQPGFPGGIWKGKKAVVVRVDGSAHVRPTRGTAGNRYLPREDDNTLNALDVATYMPPGVQFLNPAQ